MSFQPSPEELLKGKEIEITMLKAQIDQLKAEAFAAPPKPIQAFMMGLIIVIVILLLLIILGGLSLACVAIWNNIF